MRVLTIIPQNEQAQPWIGCLCQVLGTFFLLPDERLRLPGGASRKPRLVGLEIRKWPAANCQLPVATICIGIWEVNCCELESIIVISCYILGSQPALWTALSRHREDSAVSVPCVIMSDGGVQKVCRKQVSNLVCLKWKIHMWLIAMGYIHIKNIFKNYEP